MIAPREYNYGEAYMLMWYACNKCDHRERIWNSRDGVTPLCIGCPSCDATLSHVDWNKDEREVNHELHEWQRFFRDGTQNEAIAISRKRIETLRKHGYAITQKEEKEMIGRIVEGKAHEFQKGWPMLDIKIPCYKESK